MLLSQQGVSGGESAKWSLHAKSAPILDFALDTAMTALVPLFAVKQSCVDIYNDPPSSGGLVSYYHFFSPLLVSLSSKPFVTSIQVWKTFDKAVL